MKKYVFAVAAALAFTACKKNEQPDQLVVNPPATAATSVVNQDEMTKVAESKPKTNLALSENHFDFGKIKKGDKVSHTYTVTNTGTNPLIISAVKPGCGCTAPEYSKDPIMPGASGKITLSFDSSSFDGLVNKQAEVYANVAKVPLTITFSADIQNK